MRRPTPRKPVKLLIKPSNFPPQNVLTRAMPPELVGQKEFEHYHFIGFDLSQADLAGRLFSDCLFENCNLAGSTIANASLQNVAFEGCKLLGVQFEVCRDMLFGVHFDKCQLDYASFHGKVMPNTRFVGCSLQEANFTQTDLSGAVFHNCQLRRAVFSRTRLIGADFRTAQEVLLDPEQNEMKQARFSLEGLPGLLSKYDLVIS
ncbi:pentapeptide repeat-containing protein [Hymenobacter tenuis]